ncbi:unnamed protein product [Effrenium voratum]|nr:unnamed protein product [Effrenium voratum]
MSPCITYRPWLGSCLGSRLETALQAAVLRRSALAEAQPQPSPGLLAPVRLPQRRPQRAEGPQPPGPAVLNYFKEKLDECLEDRRRFFERYLLLRELCLSRACGLPQLRPAVSQPCRGDKPTPEEVLAEWERTWLPSDQALLEARVLRARARHRRFFEEVRAKEMRAEALLRQGEESRGLDAERLQLLQRLTGCGTAAGSAAWRWRGT